ncbi:hypothetical protein [Endozoicomonas sp. 4G]|uniref:hypothetical protein n=1 Tax=Endozoicomonas sp. 4G TaxID=2872754 RepID=UPI002078542A|nr:hypothetical protein [Endozoicomonas sp. 4G]
MDVNVTGAGACGLNKSSLAEKNDENSDSQKKVFKGFSRMLRVGGASLTPVEKMQKLDAIVPDCSHQAASRTIPERKVSHCITSDDCQGVDEASGLLSETFTAKEVAERLRTTIVDLIHSLGYEKLIREYGEDDQRDELIEIFIDFVLYQEGLVHDRCLTVEGSPNKYVAGKTMSQGRVEEIQSFLKFIFTERAVKESKRYEPLINYRFGDMLADYLNKKENEPDDVIPKIVISKRFGCTEFRYVKLLEAIFPFFQTLLGESGFFSELFVIFDFVKKFRQEIIDSACEPCQDHNLITIALRLSNDIREPFNQEVMEVIFSRRCDGIVNAMFDNCAVGTDTEVKRAGRLNLKFGEELEYDINNQLPESQRMVLSSFSSRLKQKGMSYYPTNNGRSAARYGFHDSFTVLPFYDLPKWLEINCTPYHSDDQLAEISFEKVIEVIDSMRNEGLIDYSSGHKHVDALSATQGDTSVLLALESEIQRHPFLLRAFGNNDRILQDDEAQWYKTFADYDPGLKPFALKRLNKIIDRYNKKIEENDTEKPNHKGSTDSEKKERLEQFANFYSQLVHSTTLQKVLGNVTANVNAKCMAMSLLHITGAKSVKKFSTLEFRFFRCPKTVQEIKLINQFLQVWFQNLNQSRKDKTPLQPVPENIRSCKDYTAEEVQAKTIDYLRELGLNPEDYRCFWSEVRDIP